MRFLLTYKSTLFYIVLIVLVNTLFSYIPLFNVFGAEISPMDPTVGVVYVLRDFAQREIQHKVLLAMLLGSILSYFLADKTVALASIASFLVAEMVDWAIFTFTRKPLSQRILWSSVISSPIDSIVFLYIVHQLNWLGCTVLSCAKVFGVFVVWYMWRMRDRRNATLVATAA